MNKQFPLHYTLDDGTEVVVTKTDAHRYDFILKGKGTPDRNFSYNDSEEFTDEKEAALDFDELNALRRFWLETRDEG